MTPWYEESFGREYLNLYAHRDLAEARGDIDAVLGLLSLPRDEPLLDLCCGAGRHLIALREEGLERLVGLDLSNALLREAAESLSDEGRRFHDRSRLIRADMRAIPFEGCFAAVLSFFTSFGYFEEDEENQAVLEAIHSSLRPNGTFLMDYLNREHVISHLVPMDERVLPDRYVRNFRRLTEDCRRVEKTTLVVTEAGTEQEFHESVRLYSAAEMRAMLEAVGFVELRTYGSLEGQPFGSESSRLVIVARKKGGGE